MFNYFKNAFWMLIDHSINMLSMIAVTIYIAKNWGPDDLGVISYALAILAILTAFARMGMDSILIKQIVSTPSDYIKLISNGFYLILIVGASCFLLLFIILSFSSYENKFVVLIIGATTLFLPFSVIEYKLQAQLNSKSISINRVISCSIFSLLKIYVISSGHEVFLLAYCYFFEVLFFSILNISTLTREEIKKIIFSLNLVEVKSLFKAGSIVAIAGILVTITMRVDILLLKNFFELDMLGIYSAGMKIYEGMISVVTVLTFAILPLFVKKFTYSDENKEVEMYYKIYCFMFWGAFLISLFIYFNSKLIIESLYGSDFFLAQSILEICIFALPFYLIGCLNARYFIVRSEANRILIRAIHSIALSIPLQYILVRKFGVLGAACGVLIVQIYTNIFVSFFEKKINNTWNFIIKGVFFPVWILK